MKKRNLIIAACLCIGLFGACAAEGNQEVPAESPVQEENSSEETSGEETPVEQHEEDIRDYALKQSDADQMVSEKLDGTGYDYRADGMTEDDGNHYYLYRVHKGDQELAQGLAVDDISGEVLTYDFAEELLSGYEDFELYDALKDEPVLWEGSYSKDDTVITLLPADHASSEIHVSVGGKETFVGMIYFEGDTALVEEKGFTTKLTLDADELMVEDQKGKSGFSGDYVLE